MGIEKRISIDPAHKVKKGKEISINLKVDKLQR